MKNVCFLVSNYMFSILLSFIMIFNIIPLYAKNLNHRTPKNTLNRVLTFPQTSLNPITSPFFRPGVFEDFFIQDPKSGAAICRICEKIWKKNDRQITVTLKQNLKFHDGKSLTANDVAFSYRIITHPQIDAPYLKIKTQGIESISVLSQRKLLISFSQPPIDTNLYKLFFPILPQHRFSYFLQRPKDFNRDLKLNDTDIIGSGPYRFKKWLKNQYIEFERNPQWWGFKEKDLALYQFSIVRYKFIFNPVTKIISLKRGDIDIAELSPAEFQNLSNSTPPHLIVEKIQTPIPQNLTFIGWNLKHPLLKSRKIRHALSLLTPTHEKLHSLTDSPTNSPWASDFPHNFSYQTGIHSKKKNNGAFKKTRSQINRRESNITEARKILSQEGWLDRNRDGILDKISTQQLTPFQFQIYAPMNFHTEWLEAYQQKLRKSGIKMNIKYIEWNTLEKLIKEKKFAAVLIAKAIAFPLQPFVNWHQNGSLNHWGLNSPKINQITKALSKKSREAQLYPRLLQELRKELPITWLWITDTCLIGRSLYLKGLQASQGNQCLHWPTWYKEF